MSLKLVLGGTRSGKSLFAEDLAGREGERILYVATAMREENDPDLDERVLEHQSRRPANWGTLEIGGGDLGAVSAAADGWDAVLLDSLTMWASARMVGGETDEETLYALERFANDAAKDEMVVVVVSDEVGLGVVPESAGGRRFRDSLGSLNQSAAAAASEVYLCVAGLPMRLK